jgi:hypothetical protein
MQEGRILLWIRRGFLVWGARCDGPFGATYAGREQWDFPMRRVDATSFKRKRENQGGKFGSVGSSASADKRGFLSFIESDVVLFQIIPGSLWGALTAYVRSPKRQTRVSLTCDIERQPPTPFISINPPLNNPRFLCRHANTLP